MCIASFEMKPIKTLERMGRQWSGQNPELKGFSCMSEAKERLLDLYGQFRDWTSGKLYLYDQQGTVSAKQVCAVVRFAAKEKGVTHFVVDSLMKCVAGEDDYNGQKAFVDELTAIARDYQMHIHLVHHIKKPVNEEHKPNKYDFKGSGSITDQVDNVISVWRNKPKERSRESNKPHDCVKAHSAVVNAVAAGEILPSEGQAMSKLIDAQRRAYETHDLAKRLEAIEAAIINEGVNR